MGGGEWRGSEREGEREGERDAGADFSTAAAGRRRQRLPKLGRRGVGVVRGVAPRAAREGDAGVRARRFPIKRF